MAGRAVAIKLFEWLGPSSRKEGLVVKPGAEDLSHTGAKIRGGLHVASEIKGGEQQQLWIQRPVWLLPLSLRRGGWEWCSPCTNIPEFPGNAEAAQ